MDYAACMKDEDNIDDKLSLSWFKGWLGGLEIISNKESKIKQVGNFEFNDQEKIYNFKKHFVWFWIRHTKVLAVLNLDHFQDLLAIFQNFRQRLIGTFQDLWQYFTIFDHIS